MPATSDGLLDWSDVEARLVVSPQYWMATTAPDGRPHVVPRWGVWVDGRLFTPVKAMARFDFPTDVTRFRFNC